MHYGEMRAGDTAWTRLLGHDGNREALRSLERIADDLCMLRDWATVRGHGEVLGAVRNVLDPFETLTVAALMVEP